MEIPSQTDCTLNFESIALQSHALLSYLLIIK